MRVAKGTSIFFSHSGDEHQTGLSENKPTTKTRFWFTTWDVAPIQNLPFGDVLYLPSMMDFGDGLLLGLP